MRISSERHSRPGEAADHEHVQDMHRDAKRSGEELREYSKREYIVRQSC
jgi:hypothetical protein